MSRSTSINCWIRREHVMRARYESTLREHVRSIDTSPTHLDPCFDIRTYWSGHTFRTIFHRRLSSNRISTRYPGLIGPSQYHAAQMPAPTSALHILWYAPYRRRKRNFDLTSVLSICANVRPSATFYCSNLCSFILSIYYENRTRCTTLRK